MDEVLPALPAGAVWIQMSTVGVEWADRLSQLANAHGVAIVDAPVMGSRPQAEEGTLVPLAAGSEQACALVAPVLEAFSRHILWLGDQRGLGSRLKLVANHWILNSVENLAETLAFADALDLDPRRFLELISGAPFDMQYAHWKAELMLGGDFPPVFALRLACKDIGLALEAAAAEGMELPLAEATSQRQSRAIELGYGDADSAATYVVARHRPEVTEQVTD
jgi:3-hydroxyisobutyrate dehydrogenase